MFVIELMQSMLKKIFFGIFIGVCIIAGIYWFSYLRDVKTPISEGINAIPQNAAIIFESKQVKNTWKKLSQTNIMWEELMSTVCFSKLNFQTTYIDSLIQLNPAVSKLLDQHSVFISAHPNSQNSFDFLFVYSLPNITHHTTIEQFIKSVNNGTEPSSREFKDEHIFTIKPKNKNACSFSFVNGTLIICTQQSLLEASITQLKTGISIAKDKNFSKVINTAGKNVDANIYVNYFFFPDILNQFIHPSFKNETTDLSYFANCSGWDVTIKPNALMLSGFTQANDSSMSFLSLFNHQKPQEIAVTKIIPYRTALMFFLGISNSKSFYSDYKKHLEKRQLLQKHESFISNINKKYKINIESSIFEWVNNEMALVITEPDSSDYTNNSFAIIRSNDIVVAQNALNKLIEHIEKTDEQKQDTIHYKKHIISNLNLPNLLPELFGWQFKKITQNYFTSIDDYIVFGNNVDAIKSFITEFENNKTLINDKNYKSFSENISSEANVYLYTSIPKYINILSTFISSKFESDFKNKTDLIRKFEATAIQFSSNNKLFYSTIYLKYNPVYKQESGTLWELKLDSTLSTKPYLLINHNTKAKDVFVQDDGNKIYLISNTGKIIWTKQLHEKIMSDVVQIDVLKNDKLQMVFNTRSYIYMFDRNGNDMNGFPLKLKSSATNAVSLIDYENNKDYRLFIACENKKILCFKANGELVTGFNFDKTANQVYLPIQYFNANAKDNLCAVDGKGKIYILNRQGGMRVKIKEQIENGTRNFFIEPGKDYHRTYIIAADTLGNVVKINLSGEKENIKLQDFETSPYFDYQDLNNDKTKEYIFLTRNELKVFSQDKSLLFKYEFKDPISQTPLFFLFPDGKEKIGISSEATNELFLFNENGSLYNSFPLSGKTPFSIGDINNEGTFNLISGSSENSIYVYPIH